MKTMIVTDSISDLTQNIAAGYDIEVLPIRIALDGDYQRVYDLNVSDTVEWILQNKKSPKFKGVGPEYFAEIFEKYINQEMEIVCITAGSKIISNYDCACHASTQFPNAKIQVLDSHQLCVSVGFIALKAAALAKKDLSADIIASTIKNSMKHYKQYGIADTVDFLQYAGICPKVVSVGSSLLNAKFEFEVQEDMNFVVKVLGTSMKKAVPSYCKNVFKHLDKIDPEIIFIMYTESDESYNRELYHYVSSLNYFKDIVMCRAGHYTNSLVGQNGMSIAVQMKL
ncbi:MAG: DegV family protein [Eubacteriales bacterium]